MIILVEMHDEKQDIAEQKRKLRDKNFLSVDFSHQFSVDYRV